MTITFRLPATAAERLAFSYSPCLEAVLSLHVIVEPKHHPAQHPWVRAMRSLSPELKREIATFAFAYRNYFPECFFPSAYGELLDFDEELDRLSAIDPGLMRLEFAIPFLDPSVGRDAAALDDREIRAGIRRRASEEGEEVAHVAELIIDDPALVLERFVSLLRRYWAEAFRSEWERVEPRLADSVSEAGRQLADEGLYALLQSLWPEVRSDRDEERFWLERPHDHEVDIGPGDGFALVPSVYVWPHVRVNCDEPWPLGLIFPASYVVREAEPRLPPRELVAVLRALGDDTRLRALRFIAERPRSTQELAELVGISEAGLSKHLRVLAEAGLLERRREGYYVLYRLVEARVGAVAPSLLRFLRAN
jgi:DNA-binding transcriptional ArsR family regulator